MSIAERGRWSVPCLVTVVIAAAPADLSTQEVVRPSGSPARATEVVAAYDRLGHRDLWPGFDPGTVPIAIYDGTDTWLFRHPSPPERFRTVPGTDGAAVRIDGRQLQIRLENAGVERSERGVTIHVRPADSHRP